MHSFTPFEFDSAFNEQNPQLGASEPKDSPFDTAREAAGRTRVSEIRADSHPNYSAENLCAFGITDAATQQKIQQERPFIRRFALDCRDETHSAIAALILQQAIENYQVSTRVHSDAHALQAKKTALSGKDAEHATLVNNVASMRHDIAPANLPGLMKQAIDQATAPTRHVLVHTEEDKAENKPPVFLETRSYKRLLTQRNDALHYSRTDLPAVDCPLVTPVELEHITAHARDQVIAHADYVFYEHYLTAALHDANLPNDWTKSVASEITALQRRLTTPVKVENDDQKNVTLSLNASEAMLFHRLAGQHNITATQEWANLVGPDHNPLLLLTLSAEDFKTVSQSFGPIPSRSR